MPVDVTQKDGIISKLETKYKDTMLRGNEYPTPDRIPFGSLELDYITNGGVPMGRWTRMYGGFSATKTRSCYGLVATAQSMGLQCSYYNVEKQFDTEAFEACGGDAEALDLVEGSVIEEIGEKLEAMLGVSHLHIIDSCSAGVSLDELNADISDWRPGIAARAWGKVLRRANERFDRRENAIIMIDQMRVEFGARGRQASDKPPGGRFLNFQSSLNLHFERGGWLQYDKNGYLTSKGDPNKGVGGSLEPDGREISVRCEKSRLGRPELAAKLYFDLRKYQFDTDWEYVKALKELGFAAQKGSWWEVKVGKTKKKVQGDAGLRELLNEFPKLRDTIYQIYMDGSD